VQGGPGADQAGSLQVAQVWAHAGLHFESVFTEQIVGSARASAIEELVIFLLRRSQFRILVMEDVHWFDGPSIELPGAVARRLCEFLIVVTQRTETATMPKELPAVELTPSLQVRLDGLSRGALIVGTSRG
jgi:adenylate cyclase